LNRSDPRAIIDFLILAQHFFTTRISMTNDTQVFYAMRVNSITGEMEPVGRAGTVEAIHRDGFKIDPLSENYCPPEWLDQHGYVDLERARKNPLPGEEP
jgi:hypothetical protein